MKTLSGEHWTIHVADVMDGLAAIESNSVHCCVTSPPYWGLRDYGFEGQIGSEKTPDEFVAKLVEVFRGVRRVLRDDGVLFVNVGDSYASDAKWSSRTTGKHADYLNEDSGVGRNRTSSGLADLNMVGIPWRVAFALQADGWVLRSENIWYKPSPMPTSVSGTRWERCKKKLRKGMNATETHPGSHKATVTDRKGKANRHCIGGEWIGVPEYEECAGCRKCEANGGFVLRRGSWRPTTSHEQIFMFAKGPKYFSDGDTSKEPCSGGAHSRGKGVCPKTFELDPGENRAARPKANSSFRAACTEIVETRNMRTVWKISPEPFKKAHFAVFPTELVRRCLVSAISKAGCCSGCGNQYAPIVESVRKATRPGNDTKVGRVSAQDGSPYEDHLGMIVGNRDPQRHTTITNVVGYRPTCRCSLTVGRPVVLDPFAGSCTTGQVAINLGCRFIGIDGSEVYAGIGAERIETPWVPVSERKKSTGKKRQKKVKNQGVLFG